jgi:hypothetical protein
VNPLIAVVVPAYKQPQFLAGAALSALDQRPPVATRVVVVNDGCPFPATHRIGTALAQAHPERVRYVRQPNAGLSAARNTGIAEALATWPDVDAIFPLDADNLLSPGTLPALWDVLERDPDVAWASPDQEIFGAINIVWAHQPFSTYRQLFENQTDAGTLFRRSVFDSGLRYAEEMPAFEDWLFVLEAALAGFTGVPAGRCGFRYRRREHSMLIDALRTPDVLTARIRARLPAAYATAELVRREHDEAPRFALLGAADDEARMLAATDLEPARSRADDYLATVRASRGGTTAGHAHVPPVTITGSAPLFEWLHATGLLPGVLLRAQLLLRERLAVAVRLIPDPGPDVLDVVLGGAGGATPAHAIAVRTRDLARRPVEDDMRRVEIRAGALHAPPRCDIVSLPAAAEPQRALGTDPTLSSFCALQHIDKAQTALPWSGAGSGRSLWFVTRAPCPGAEDDSTLQVSAALHALEPAAALHLLVIGAGGIRAAATAIGHFDTITMLSDEEAVPELVARVLAGAEVVFHGGGAGVRATPERGAALHVALVGGEHTLAAADADPLLDVHLVRSDAVGRRLVHLGATAEKIAFVREDAIADDVLDAIRIAGARHG